MFGSFVHPLLGTDQSSYRLYYTGYWLDTCSLAQIHAEKRAILMEFVANLIRCNCMYDKLSSGCASAPLIVPELRPAKFWFLVGLRSVNKYTVYHHLLMSNVENELHCWIMHQCTRCFICHMAFGHSYWTHHLKSEIMHNTTEFTHRCGYYKAWQTPYLICTHVLLTCFSKTSVRSCYITMNVSFCSQSWSRSIRKTFWHF